MVKRGVIRRLFTANKGPEEEVIIIENNSTECDKVIKSEKIEECWNSAPANDATAKNTSFLELQKQKMENKRNAGNCVKLIVYDGVISDGKAVTVFAEYTGSESIKKGKASTLVYMLFKLVLHWLVLGFIFSIYCIILCGAKENKEKQKKDKPPTPTVAKTEKTSKSAKKGSNKNSKNGARRTAPSKSDRTQNSVEQPPQQLMLLNDVKKTQQTKTTGEELQTTPEGSKEKEKDTNKAVVNEYVKKAAAEGNILDPKHVKNMGNIDDIEKENHVDKVKDLENIKSEPDPQSVSMVVPLDPKKRVSINETACKLYETNDIATMEDGEDNQEGEV